MVVSFRRFFLWTACALMAAWACGAGTAPASDLPLAPRDTVDWAINLPELTVTATRIPTTVHNAPASITRIDSTALVASGSATVADVLERRSSVHIRRASAYGLASASSRGSGASQTLVLLDGHRIANPQLGQTDLSLIPSVLLQSVEVMQGPAAPLYGSDGMGGAVHLRTRAPAEPALALTTQAGAFGQHGGDLLVGDRTGNWSWVAAARYEHLQGDFPYEDRARFPVETVRRDNADRTQYSAFVSTHTANTDRSRVAALVTATNRGLPGTSSLAANTERQRDRSARMWGHHRWRLASGTLTTRGFAQYDAIRYRNPEQSIDDTGHTYVASTEAEWEGGVAEAWRLNTGLSAQSSWARHPSLRSQATQQHAGLAVSAVRTGDRVRWYPAVRVDAYRVPEGANRVATAPRLGINLTPLPAYDALRLKAHVGRAFRMPTLNDRYWQPGGVPDLRPERGWSADAGVRWQRASTHASLTIFEQRHTDRIVWTPTTQGFWAPQNVQRVRTRGVEADAATMIRMLPYVDITAGFSAAFTDARDRSNPESSSYNQPLRYTPRTTFTPYVTASVGALALDVNVRRIGRRYTTSDGSRSRAPYLTADTQLRVEQQWNDLSVQLRLQVENLFNTDYTLLNNQPVPPRHGTVSLRAQL